MGDDRYARQRILPQVGEAGQARLAGASVLVVGLGALGCPAAELLARAGVGRLKLLDRDVVEMSNLQRQTLYSSADVGQAKAMAAVGRLAAVNPTIKLVPLAADLNSANVEGIAGDADVIVEATDNAQARYLVNDLSVKLGIPWVYGGAVGVDGRVAGFRASRGGPCLRCLFRDPPGAGELPTCDTAGVLNTLTATVGALQAQVALRLIVEPDWVPAELLSVQMWPTSIRSIDISEASEPGCPCCGERRFEFLGAPAQGTSTLCGNGTVQVLPPAKAHVDLAALSARWRKVGTPAESRHMLRMELLGEGLTVTLFGDGRLLIRGLDDVDRARAIYDRLVGS